MNESFDQNAANVVILDGREFRDQTPPRWMGHRDGIWWNGADTYIYKIPSETMEMSDLNLWSILPLQL